MTEAVDILNRDGLSVGAVHLSELWPFPGQQMARMLTHARKWAVVENNSTGQLARLIQMEIQKKPDARILKYDGRPFMAKDIAEGFRKEVEGR